MAPTRTRTVKNKHAAPKAQAGTVKGGNKRSSTDGVSKTRKPPKSTPPASAKQTKQLKDRNPADLHKKHKKKVYTAAQLGIPELNMITPVGVVKPKGKKKGKVFVDDKEGMNTIMSIVQAEKDGQIESKMIKARQLEEIREARKVEAEIKENERKEKMEDTKASLRKKRKRKSTGDEETMKQVTDTGSRASKPKKRVSFA